jgi:hypothetical protein
MNGELHNTAHKAIETGLSLYRIIALLQLGIPFINLRGIA